ncbi:MAG: hypothetical protein JWO27_2345, partial [Frankiales bacterium]|nr:hypothetical protein [Frankiales bacterium]
MRHHFDIRRGVLMELSPHVAALRADLSAAAA